MSKTIDVGKHLFRSESHIYLKDMKRKGTGEISLMLAVDQREHLVRFVSLRSKCAWPGIVAVNDFQTSTIVSCHEKHILR